MNIKPRLAAVVDSMLEMMTIIHSQVRQGMLAHDETGTTIQRLFILRILSQKGSLSLTDVSLLVHFKKNALSQLLQRMHGDGLIRRGGDPADRRKVMFFITPAGREALRKMRDKQVECVSGLLAHLDAAEIEEFIQAHDQALAAFRTLVRLKEKRPPPAPAAKEE